MWRGARRLCAVIGTLAALEFKWGIAERLYGLPGHIDDGKAWGGWLSMVATGWQWYDYFLLLLAALSFSYVVTPQRYVDKWCAWVLGRIRASDQRQDKRKMLLRDLRALREALEKRKVDPYDRDAAIRIDLLTKKHAVFWDPVRDDLDEMHGAALFCIATLEIEDDFAQAMQTITERLQRPFSVELKATFRYDARPRGSATIQRAKKPQE